MSTKARDVFPSFYCIDPSICWSIRRCMCFLMIGDQSPPSLSQFSSVISIWPWKYIENVMCTKLQAFAAGKEKQFEHTMKTCKVLTLNFYIYYSTLGAYLPNKNKTSNTTSQQTKLAKRSVLLSSTWIALFPPFLLSLFSTCFQRCRRNPFILSVTPTGSYIPKCFGYCERAAQPHYAKTARWILRN